MSKLGVVAVAVVVVIAALAAAALYLGNSDLPPPSKQVEKILPDGRFPK